MKLNIEERTAVITGADSGIGLATAKILAAEGATVILSDLEQGQLDKAVEELKAQVPAAKATSIAADLSKNDSVLQLAEVVQQQFGGAHILINCAGARGAAGDFLTLTDEDWQQTIDIDLMGAVRVCRAFIPQLQKNGWGRVVLVSSENAFQPYEEESPYNACKAGIINLSKCLSRAYANDGLVFNCVSPAFIETPMTNAMMDQLAKDKSISREEAVQGFLKTDRPFIAMKRRGKAEEVAHVISFLASDLASYVNGSNYRVDGGSVESAFG